VQIRQAHVKTRRDQGLRDRAASLAVVGQDRTYFDHAPTLAARLSRPASPWSRWLANFGSHRLPVETDLGHPIPAGRPDRAYGGCVAAKRDVGDLHLATVVINVQDMDRAVSFWAAALGYLPRETTFDPTFMMLVDESQTGLPVSLQKAESPPKEPVRIHLDLYTDDQDAQVSRLVGLGATRVDDWPYPSNADFVVLRDPDGNEFCVIDHAEL